MSIGEIDWRVLLSTFGAVFVAELGDKTQLATLALAGASGRTWTVFVGAATALVLTSLLGALLGGWLHRVVDPVWITRSAGALFLLIGATLLIRSSPTS